MKVTAKAARLCTACGEPLARKQFPSGPESITRFAARETCGRACAAARKVAENRTPVFPLALIFDGADVGVPLWDRAGRVVRFAFVSYDDAAWALSLRWSLSNGYARRSEGQEKIFMHRELLGLRADSDLVGDHINGDTLDNRRSNLRAVSMSGNQQNRTTPGWGSSRHRGVSFCRQTQRWAAQANFQGRHIHLGRFATEEEAAKAAAAYRREHMPFSPDARNAA
jgi:hypothetical protein